MGANMKRIIGTLVLTAVAALCALFNLSAQDASKPIDIKILREAIESGNYAIVIGINDYFSEDISDLSYAEKDARSFAEVLEKSGGYSDNHISVLLGKDANQEAILKALGTLARMAEGEDSTILFYFSGHGFAYGDRNYIVPSDGSVMEDLIEVRNINIEKIEEKLSESEFARKFVFIDACRNQVTVCGKDIGAKGFTDVATLGKHGNGMRVFLGTQFGELSRESKDLQSGIFTYCLVEGLAGSADLNNDGVICLYELEGYLSSEMKEMSFKNARRSRSSDAGCSASRQL